MSETQHEKSHYRQASNKYGQKIQVPVIDVRDGIVERMLAMRMIKMTNKSRFIPYSEYQKSYKPQTQI